jgi:two-component system OmpR family response regulator
MLSISNINVMQSQALNLFIVDDNALMVMALKKYLMERFGSGVNIKTFASGEECLNSINEDTNIVILDYHLEGKNGNEVLKSIKERNPATQVIMFSSNENIGTAVESLRLGATDFVVKGHSGWKKISKLVNGILTAPLRYIVREFRIEKFMSIFFLTFILLAIIITIIIVAVH